MLSRGVPVLSQGVPLPVFTVVGVYPCLVGVYRSLVRVYQSPGQSVSMLLFVRCHHSAGGGESADLTTDIMCGIIH